MATTTKSNSNLTNAKKAKNDEFYTQLTDIEKEMRYYKPFFKGKVVYCNCDDARESNFFKYFSLNFEHLGLKKLISTGYKENGKGVVLIYEGDKNGNRQVDADEIQVTELKGNGDFRSEECIEFLKECDVVVTNPPFSLFREYVAQLIEYGKKFLVLANNNAITYKEFFPYIKENKVWLGRTLFTGQMPYFKVPNDYPLTNERFEKRADGLYKQVNAICWYTNIPNDTNKEILCAYREYSNEYHVKYDNYDAIECGRMSEFPINYNGVIGIPITGLKYLWSDGKIHIEINGQDTQFEIVGLCNDKRNDNDCFIKCTPTYLDEKHKNFVGCIVKGKATYARIFIKKLF